MSTELYKPKITEFGSEEQLYNYAETFVLDEMLETIGEEGSFRLALSGGGTPLPLYHALGSNSSLPWEDVELYQIDERYVSPSEDESNQKHIKEMFGEDTLERCKDVYFFKTETDLDECVRHYEAVMESLEAPSFDLSIVGIGKDGHFASLFPKGDYLSHQESKIITTEAPAEYTTKTRLSQTIEQVLDSKKILVLLKGEDKAAILHELIKGEKSASDYPAKFLLAHPDLTIFAYIPKTETEED